MKKALALALALVMLLSMTACASLFAADYYDSYPFVEESGAYQGDQQEIRNYAILKAAILELIKDRTEQASFRFGNYSGSLVDDLAEVCVEIKNDDPLGAYAVESISYDTSRIVSYYTADISIRYKKSSEEIAAVQSVSGLGEFGSHVRSFMESYGEKTVVKVYSSVINEDYIVQLVRDYCYADPLLCVLQPRVTVQAYPASGAERIYEISLNYGGDREALLAMDEILSLRVEELGSSVGEGQPLEKALRLARNLSDMAQRGEENAEHPGTAYGCLVEGDGDPLGMAMAYKALCDFLGLECLVVEGEYKDEVVSAHAWNIIAIEGEYYHVDVSHFAVAPEKAFLLSDDDIWGDYYWSKDDYPVCSGSLGPGDVFEPPVEEQPQPGPEQTPPPEAEPSPEPEPEVSPDENEGENGAEEEIENN